MDAHRKVTIFRNERGVALLLVALLLLGICGFLALAIDIGYRHVAKGQLQNAADAAALAGAARLDPSGKIATAPTDARATALEFAAKNKTASKDVAISSDGSNSLSESNDVRLGNWSPLTRVFEPGANPVNAIQVRARRTGATDVGGASIGGPLDLIVAPLLGTRWAQIGVSAIATAHRGPRAGFYIALGKPACSIAGEQVLSPEVGNMAWTSLLNPSTNVTDLTNYLCTEHAPDPEICGDPPRKIYTTNGTANSLFQAAETDFYDQNYDRANKTFDAGGRVLTWTANVPVVEVIDPTPQPLPIEVWGYARIVLTRICGTGNGEPCLTRPIRSPGGVCKNAENDLVISSITCTSCADSSTMDGATTHLVE